MRVLIKKEQLYFIRKKKVECDTHMRIRSMKYSIQAILKKSILTNIRINLNAISGYTRYEHTLNYCTHRTLVATFVQLI